LKRASEYDKYLRAFPEKHEQLSLFDAGI